MNKCYALVWNVSQGCWNVVSEGSRRRGKPAGAKAAIASALALLGATAPGSGLCAAKRGERWSAGARTGRYTCRAATACRSTRRSTS